MPNEEPEGPNIPPSEELGKSLKINDSYLKLKGCIAAATAALIVAGYLYYYYVLKHSGVKLNELYFVINGSGTAIFTALLFTFFVNSYIKTILLFTSIFYTVLEIIYVYKWVILGEPYAYFKIALIAGLVLGIIYFIYDKLNDVRRSNN